MPTLQVPLIKGSGTTSDSKYTDKLPNNFVIVPRDTGNDQYYLRSFPGLVSTGDASGKSFAAEFNDASNKEYRLIGTGLYEDGKLVQDGLEPSLANTCHSARNQAFISGGKVKYWKNGKLYELENWAKGENYVAYPDYIYTPNFADGSYVEIPAYKTGPVIINFNFYLEELSDDDQFILGSKRDDSSYSGIYYKGSDKKFYVRNDNKNTLIKEAEKGVNFVSVTVTKNFNYALEFIGAVKKGSEITKNNAGQITDLLIYPQKETSSFRKYELKVSVERDSEDAPDAPESKVIDDGANDSTVTNGTLVGDWVGFHQQVDPTSSPATDFNLNEFLDVDRIGSQFVAVKGNLFICTALSGGDGTVDLEHRPAYISPETVQRSDPDTNKAIRNYQNKFVGVFGRHTTEYFVSTADPNQPFAPAKNYEVSFGIVSTGAVCKFMKGFAALGSTKDGANQLVFTKPGSYEKISTATIDRAIQSYSDDELQGVLLESFSKENHQFLLVHLPKQTFLYDGSTGQFTTLSTGYGRNLSPYQGRHFVINKSKGITAHANNKLVKTDDTVSSQVGDIQEFIAYTPFVEVVKGRGSASVSDITFDSIYGHVNKIQTAFISSTMDGLTFQEEEDRIEFNEPNVYMRKVYIDFWGPVVKSIGFKINCTSSDPVTLSDLSMEID